MVLENRGGFGGERCRLAIGGGTGKGVVSVLALERKRWDWGGSRTFVGNEGRTD